MTDLLSQTINDMTAALAPFAARSIQRVTTDEANVKLMLHQPWRITRAVYYTPHGITSRTMEWPPEIGMTATDVLNVCATKINAVHSLGRAGHWTYDMNWHIGLMQAETALLAMIMRPDGWECAETMAGFYCRPVDDPTFRPFLLFDTEEKAWEWLIRSEMAS